MRLQAPRGTEDVLPPGGEHWEWLEGLFREVCSLYGYEEIRTPTFEDTSLFVRGIGETTDIVFKEMYTFADRGGRSITLKPEGTAPAIRAYVEHALGAPGQVTKLFYITPIFRYERPQKGRLRESHQTGLELIGADSPEADAEVIELTVRWYKRLGLTNLRVKLNSLGMAQCRDAYREALLGFAALVLADLPEEFRLRCERNPLRLLDSKDPAVAEALALAPPITDFLEPESKEHFETLQSLLAGVGVNFELDPRLVRGLDYYTKTVFELQAEALGAQNALCGGGRYDGLIEACGGPPTPAVGVAMGIERALIVLKALNVLSKAGHAPTVFAICLTDRRCDFEKLKKDLRDAGVSVVSDMSFRSPKSQFRQADKSGAEKAVIVGDEELGSGLAKVKDLRTGEETSVPIESLASHLRTG